MNYSNKENSKKRWLKRIWSLLPIIFLILVILFLGGLTDSKKSRIEAQKEAALGMDEQAINVVTLNLERKPLKDRINLPAVAKPWVDLKVLTQVRGKVIKKVVSEGDTVNKNDPLILIDSQKYTNGFEAAKASYKAAIASKKRTEKLFREKLASQADLDGVSAEVENLRAAMKNAKLDLERCTVKAPISGVVNNLYIEEGQLLNDSDPVAQILQSDKIKVSVGIPESDVIAVRKIDSFDVTFDSIGDKIYSAKKYYLSKSADPLAKIYNLDLEIDNISDEILPDMFARVEIVKQFIPDSIKIPLYAVISTNSKNSVFTVKDNVAVSKEIRIGLQEGWEVQVVKGLDISDKLVVVGQRSVSNGQPVNIIDSVTDLEELTQ